MTFGATREEWSHFRKLLGDAILPTVCDPDAKGTPNSKIKAFNKIPSLYAPDGCAYGIRGFPTHKATERQIDAWAKDGRYGICVVTRDVRVLDIDITDANVVAMVEAAVFEALGELPTRVGNAPKRSYFFKIRQSKPERKRRIITDFGPIEFLGDLQQSVVAGMHKSGARYTWTGGLPDELPEIDIAKLEKLWDALSEAYDNTGNRQFFDASAGLSTRPPKQNFIQQEDPAVKTMEQAGIIREHLPDGRVFVTCPWEDDHTSDSGPSATIYFPVGYNGHPRPGFKCMHSHCEHRNVFDLYSEIGYEESGSDAGDFEVVPRDAFGAAPLPELVRNAKNGKPDPKSLQNVVALAGAPGCVGYHIRYDEFIADISVAPADQPGSWRSLADTDYMQMRLQMEKIGVYANREAIRDAVALVADDNSVDTGRTWLESLEWDGEERIKHFGAKVLRAGDTAYAEALSLYMWTAMASRIMAPGGQVDMVPVFIGRQGNRKTSVIKALVPGPEFYVEIDLTHRDDNLARALRGKIIGELAELKGLNSKDAESTKAWVTRTHEEWVPKYKERTVNYPRRTMFIGTSNPPRFLNDPTGERRWLPITVGLDGGFLDVVYVLTHREQLWAEARELFKTKGVMWHEVDKLAAPARAAAKIRDPWQVLVNHWLDANPGSVSAAQVYLGAIQGTPSQFGAYQRARVESCLRCYGYEEIFSDSWAAVDFS